MSFFLVFLSEVCFFSDLAWTDSILRCSQITILISLFFFDLIGTQWNDFLISFFYVV